MIFGAGARQVKFTPTKKEIFLQKVRETGLQHVAAETAGVSFTTVKEHRRTDDHFKEALEEALALYRETIEAEILRRAVAGYDEPVIKNQAMANESPDWGEVAKIRKFSDALLVFHAKRHIPAYRDGFSGDETAEAGVLVVPGPLTEAEWEEQTKKK